MGAFIDITGQRFGRWVVLHRGMDKGPQARWWCRCDCGTERQVDSRYLRAGLSGSCGCLHREKAKESATKTGLYGTPEHRIIEGAKDRCRRPTNKRFYLYGGRGIEYRLPESVVEATRVVLDTIGPRPSSKHSLDRIDNSGHYEVGNIRWATASEQAANRRPWGTARVGQNFSPET